jgi:hypothetical protein
MKSWKIKGVIAFTVLTIFSLAASAHDSSSKSDSASVCTSVGAI